MIWLLVLVPLALRRSSWPNTARVIAAEGDSMTFELIEEHPPVPAPDHGDTQ